MNLSLAQDSLIVFVDDTGHEALVPGQPVYGLSTTAQAFSHDFSPFYWLLPRVEADAQHVIRLEISQVFDLAERIMRSSKRPDQVCATSAIWQDEPLHLPQATAPPALVAAVAAHLRGLH
jgi:hypothetical protein